MTYIKIHGEEEEISSSPSNFNQARVLRVINTSTSEVLLTQADEDGQTIGSMSVLPGESLIVIKGWRDVLFTTQQGLRAVSVSVSG